MPLCGVQNSLTYAGLEIWKEGGGDEVIKSCNNNPFLLQHPWQHKILESFNCLEVQRETVTSGAQPLHLLEGSSGRQRPWGEGVDASLHPPHDHLVLHPSGTQAMELLQNAAGNGQLHLSCHSMLAGCSHTGKR